MIEKQLITLITLITSGHDICFLVKKCSKVALVFVIMLSLQRK